MITTVTYLQFQAALLISTVKVKQPDKTQKANVLTGAADLIYILGKRNLNNNLVHDDEQKYTITP
jgi:hypothetical protein